MFDDYVWAEDARYQMIVFSLNIEWLSGPVHSKWQDIMVELDIEMEKNMIWQK